MKKIEIKKFIRKYLSDLSSKRSGDGLIEKHKKSFLSLTKTFRKRFSSPGEIEEYFEYVLVHIDNLNEFFKKQGRTLIPYSRLLIFAAKEELLDGFFLQKGIESRRKTTAPMLAGLEEIGNKEVDDLSNLCISMGGEDYYCFYDELGFLFFFSVAARKVLVQIPGGRTLSYLKYKKRCRKRREPLVTRSKMFKKIKSLEKKSDTMIAFQIYIRQEKAKIARRKLTQRSRHSRN